MSAHEHSSKAFWIHCNLCFVNYIQKERKIYILSCYHVACEKCGRVVKQEQVECPICKNIFERHLICNDLHPRLKELFHPRPWILKFVKRYSIVKFQTKQRDHFLLGCKKMVEYTKTLEKERDRVKLECRQAYLTKKTIANERQKLEAMLKKLLKRMETSVGNDTMQSIDMTRKTEPNKRIIHSTYNAPENEYTFDFPNESHLSKSFIL